MLLVHDTRPPFLDGRVIFTKQAEAIMPLRDPTSDLAVIAKSGSKLVKEIREKKNEGKSRQRFWEVAGSKMGKITGQCLCYLLLFVRNEPFQDARASKQALLTGPAVHAFSAC